MLYGQGGVQVATTDSSTARGVQEPAARPRATTPSGTGDEENHPLLSEAWGAAGPLRRPSRMRRRTRRWSPHPGERATPPRQDAPRHELVHGCDSLRPGRARGTARSVAATSARQRGGGDIEERAGQQTFIRDRGSRTPPGTLRRRACAGPCLAGWCPGRARPRGHRRRTDGREKPRRSRRTQCLAQRLTSPMEAGLHRSLRDPERAGNLCH